MNVLTWLGIQYTTQRYSGIQGMPCTFDLGALIQSVECEGITAIDAHVNQHAANPTPTNLPVQLCMQKKKRRISQLPICGAHFP